MMIKRMCGNLFHVLIVLVLAISGSCSLDGDGKGEEHEDISVLYPETELHGWELDETNTGLRKDYSTLEPLDVSTAGSVLYGVLYITIPDITISRKEIDYPILIQASNVTIEHCLIRPTVCGYGVPVVNMDALVSGVVIRDTEIDCSAIPIEQVGFSLIVNGDNFVIEGCDLHGGSSGISIGSTSGSAVSVAQGNYVHDLRLYTDPETDDPAHVGALTIRRSDGRGIIVRNNYLYVQPDMATGPLFIQAWRGFVNNVLVEGNLLQGYGTCLALESNACGYGGNMRAIDNRMDAWTIGGAGPCYCYATGDSGWYEWIDNYAYDSGADEGMGASIAAP